MQKVRNEVGTDESVTDLAQPVLVATVHHGYMPGIYKSDQYFLINKMRPLVAAEKFGMLGHEVDKIKFDLGTEAEWGEIAGTCFDNTVVGLMTWAHLVTNPYIWLGSPETNDNVTENAASSVTD